LIAFLVGLVIYYSLFYRPSKSKKVCVDTKDSKNSDHNSLACELGDRPVSADSIALQEVTTAESAVLDTKFAVTADMQDKNSETSNRTPCLVSSSFGSPTGNILSGSVSGSSDGSSISAKIDYYADKGNGSESD
jgi:hypothetical protein